MLDTSTCPNLLGRRFLDEGSDTGVTHAETIVELAC